VNKEVTSLPELPKSWVWTRLGDVLGFVKGKKPKNLGTRNNLLTIPYIDINAFENEIFDEFTDGDNCPLCQTDDTLIVWDGARCGLVGRGVAGAIGSTLAKLPCFEVNSTYIFYFLQSMYEFINKRPRGVGIPHVEPSLFWNIPLPLPPLLEQRRIVTKIAELFTRLDTGVEALKKVRAQLKRYRQSVLKHAFEGKLTEEWRQAHKHELEPASVLLDRIRQERHKTAKGKYKELPPLDTSNLSELPEGWAWARIGDISEAIQYGYTASSIFEATGPKMLRITDIQNNSVDWDTVPYCRIATEEKAKYLLKDGDLVFARTGATVGKSFLIRDTIPESVFASYLIRIAISRRISKIFVYSFFQSYGYWMQIYKGQLGIGQPNVNSHTLSKMLVPLSPAIEQDRIAEEIERHFSVADQIEKTVDHSLRQAEKLRHSILKRAFEGKLVPQDPNDEPAEKLLERIKAERAKHLTEAKASSKSKKKTHTKQMELV